MIKKISLLLPFVLAIFLVFIDCQRDNDANEFDIYSLIITAGNEEYIATISQNKITFSEGVPIGTTEVAIQFLAISSNAKADKSKGDKLPIGTSTINVSKENGESRSYNITISEAPPSAEKDITNIVISLNSIDYKGTISGNVISFSEQLPYGATEATIKTLEVSNNASANKREGDKLPPIGGTIIVTAQDESTKTYNVTLNIASPTSAKEITSIVVTDGTTNLTATISGTEITFENTFPTGTTQVTISTINISANATANKSQGDTLAVSGATIVVTAQDNSTKIYTITITLAPPFILIPDDNFRDRIRARVEIGNGDVSGNTIRQDALERLTYLSMNNRSISNIIGVEYMIELNYFSIHSNSLTNIDLSNNPKLNNFNVNNNTLTHVNINGANALSNLNVSFNSLTTIDVSNNLQLTRFSAGDNLLTEIDLSSNNSLNNLELSTNSLTGLNIGNNASLTYLSVDSNSLTVIDLNNNTKLKFLNASSNSLTNLDLSSNTSLTYLKTTVNSLTAMDVSSNRSLKDISLELNSLTIIDVSNNTGLTAIRVGENSLTSINIGTNTALKVLNVNTNSLTSLDISSTTSLTYLNIRLNSSLTCIQILSGQSIATVLSGSGQHFSTSCP